MVITPTIHWVDSATRTVNKRIKTMRKTIKLALVSAAALSLVACTKEIEKEIVSEGKEVQLTFSSEKPNLTDAETRTAWDGSTIVWTKGDAIRVAYTVNGNWQTASGNGSPAKMYASDNLKEAEAGEVAHFKVSTYFTDEDNASLVDPVYKFYGIYPSAVGPTNFTNAPSLSVSFPTEQTPEAESFDKSADIMYAVSSEYDGIPTDRIVDLTWNRLVAHVDISMRNLQIGSEETLESITISAQAGADLSGTHNLDITTGEITLPGSSTGVNKVVIKPTNLTLTNGAVEFWATTLPFTATELTFTVKTNLYTYVRTFTGINLQFLGNARNTLNVNMKLAQKFQDYTEDFTGGIGEFTTSGTSGIWNAGDYQGTYYMKGTSRFGSSNTDGEGWLISPYLSINSRDSELSFGQAINAYFKNSSNQSTISTEATVWARERGGEWQQITITYPTAPSTGFTDFELTSASLSSFNGKTIQIGFKYIGYASSANGGCGTWEISNFKVSNSEIVYYPSFEFTSATTADVSFGATTVTFNYSAAHLTSEPTIAIKAGSDDIFDGTPTISGGTVTANVKANTESTPKTATLVVTCEGVDNIPELVINQAGKQDLVETEATIDFSAQGYSNAQAVSSLTQAPFTVTFTDGGTATAYYDTGTAVRVYSGGTLKVSCADYKMTKIVIEGEANGGATLSSSPSGLSGQTWTGNANEVTFTAGTAKHYRFRKLTITYLAPGSPTPSTPVITLSNLPTSNIAAAGDVVTINYSIENPATGVTVSASAGSDTWVNSFDFSTAGEISFVVDPKTTTGSRTAIITVSYTGAEDKTFEITQNGTPSGDDPVTIPMSVATYATNNSWVNQQQYKTINLDANVTATAGPSTASNTGKYYTTDDTWRFYANENATLTIDAGTKTIESVTLTYTAKDYGTISKSGTNVESGSAISVNASSVAFSISQSSGNKGKIFITAISVTYK